MEMDEQQARTPPPPAMKKTDGAAPGVVGQGGGGDPSRCFLCVLIGSMVLFATCLTSLAAWAEITYKDPNYSVAITAVSGLDPATDLGRRPVLDPEFNITVGAALQSIIMRPCNGLATTVQVSYRGFQLAWATAPQVCELAGGERTRTTVVARGTRRWRGGGSVGVKSNMRGRSRRLSSMTTALEMDAPPPPATAMDAVAPHVVVGGGDPSEAPGAAEGQQPGNCFTRCRNCKITPCEIAMILVACCFMAFIACTIGILATYKDPNYSVVIGGGPGLDRRPAMEPEFNLTFSIAFRSSVGSACDERATTVQGC
uniref:Uncharacterized protein n=1 Tax=Aegilops tauschii TaxID=37682 RepID=M8BBA0_AEGTA